MTNAVSYIANLTTLSSAGEVKRSTNLLQDYPNCGIRNNDTFNYCETEGPFCDDETLGGTVTYHWSEECLWDCSWKVNPFLGQLLNFTDPLDKKSIVPVIATMPKLPQDLRCLNNCTTADFPKLYLDKKKKSQILDCSNFPNTSFIGCYLQYRPGRAGRPFVSKNYFDMAVESCIMAILKPSFYEGNTCDNLGVNLRIFNPNIRSPSLSNSFKPGGRITGPGSGVIAASQGPFLPAGDPLKNRHPWLCSLGTAGFEGIHRCGVTLISGPPQPTIFVSAAHCNYVCKNAGGVVVQTCCCKNETSPFSCTRSDFCGISPTMALAEPGDFQISCNINNLQTQPNGLSPLSTTRLNILKIINHEKYDQNVGPIGGYDISVYIVDDSQLKMSPANIWPACLPKPNNAYIPGNKGILAGWVQPLPTYYYDYSKSLGSYINDNLRERQAQYEMVNCTDPDWMKSNTYYPPGTVCYSDHAFASSVQFGVSGSGVMRPFKDEVENTTRYCWAGSLSLSKGADNPVLVTSTVQVLYNDNPSVFTDASCYMDWIASKFNLSMPADYSPPLSCSLARGSKEDVNNNYCLSRTMDIQLNETLKCEFSDSSQKCELYSFFRKLKPTVNSNFFTCSNINGNPAICANNCPGVDPNAVVVGGTALVLAPLAVATLALAPDLIGPALGAGSILAAVGLGRVTMNNRRGSSCPPGQCLAPLVQKCCALVVQGGRRNCPSFCD